jgi:hypothetical protein
MSRIEGNNVANDRTGVCSQRFHQTITKKNAYGEITEEVAVAYLNYLLGREQRPEIRNW